MFFLQMAIAMPRAVMVAAIMRTNTTGTARTTAGTPVPTTTVNGIHSMRKETLNLWAIQCTFQNSIV